MNNVWGIGLVICGCIAGNLIAIGLYAQGIILLLGLILLVAGKTYNI